MGLPLALVVQLVLFQMLMELVTSEEYLLWVYMKAGLMEVMVVLVLVEVP